MSFNLLPLDNEEIIHNLPSLNRIHNTLQLIETVKSIPNHSLTCLDPPQVNEHLNQQDSLGAEIQKQQKKQIIFNNATQLQTPQSKKKKGGCTCKKTKCIKMYCQCFALGKICTPQCACYSCCNTGENAELAQKTKAHILTKTSRKMNKGGGCTCRKSQCQKKYCECFNAGLACTDACKCCNCQNHRVSSSYFLEVDHDKAILMDNSRGQQEGQGICTKHSGQDGSIQDWKSDLDISRQVELECEKKLELTSYKQKKKPEIDTSYKSFKIIDLCCYFN